MNAAVELSPAEVRERFLWAKRQGNPAWLWPDIQVRDWREALGKIEETLRAVLAGEEPPTLDGDPAAIGLAGYTSGVGPLLGWWVETGVIRASPAVATVLELHLRHNRARAARMAVAAAALVKALAAQSVPVVVLKGAHTARTYFPDPGVRPASDIDLLVSAKDALAAETVLLSLGHVLESRAARESSWRPVGAPTEPRSLGLVHGDDPWSVDLHTSLDVFVSAGAPLAKLDALEPMAGGSVLSQPTLLLHLAVHAGSGMQNLTLLRLVELVLVIRKDLAEGRLSWDAFVEAGERAGALGYAYPALWLCEQLAPGLTPSNVLDRCAAEAPPAVRRHLGRLTPATAQRIDGASLSEHFMWTRGWGGRLRQLVWDIIPPADSWQAIYEKRAWRLIQGTFSR